MSVKNTDKTLDEMPPPPPDNAPAQSLWLQWLMCMTVAFELVDHPPYSADLAPSDYLLFPNMKQTHLPGKQCLTDDEVISAVEDFFEDQEESFNTTGIQALQHRRKKTCVDRRGDYVEK